MHASFKSDVLKYLNIMNLHAFKIRGDFCYMQTVKTQIRHDRTIIHTKGETTSEAKRLMGRND